MLKGILNSSVFIAFVLGSGCQPYHATYREGRVKTVIRSYKYPNLFFPMTIVGRRSTMDTVTNKVVERSYYRTGVGPLGQRNINRTVTYDGKNRKEKEVIVKNGRRTTFEYVRND